MNAKEKHCLRLAFGVIGKTGQYGKKKKICSDCDMAGCAGSGLGAASYGEPGRADGVQAAQGD